MQRDTVSRVRSLFEEKFGALPASVVFAPGRVNIIGEHTDYNDGFVLPAAVDLATFIAFTPREDATVRIFSDACNECVEFPLEKAGRDGLPFWGLYPWGTAMSLLEADAEVKAFDGCVVSTVPTGGGLSSSASFEVALALAYLGADAQSPSKSRLVHLCRRAENDFVGVNCGVMDQFASIFGVDGHALMLDCRSLDCRHVPFPADAALVVSDTSVRHALGETGYHKRQEECSAAAAILAEIQSGVESLRDVTPEMLDANASLLTDVLLGRARHVVTENDRVHRAADALEKGDLACLGKLMTQSHESLKNDFEVSCPELDAMVDAADALEGNFGTRMTGGGFGGCTVSLV